MNKLIVSLLSFIFCFSTMRATSVEEQPDFAFPQTVITNADSVLRFSKSPRQCMAAVMQIATSKYIVDRDSIQTVNELLAGYSKNATDPAIKALINLYRVELLTNFYQHNRFRVNKIEAPLNPLPQNPTDWSGDQFKMVLGNLITESLDYASRLRTIDISVYKDVIASTDNSRAFYPHLSDFVFLMAKQYASIIDDSILENKTQTNALAAQPVGTLQWAVWLENNTDLLYKEFKEHSSGLVGGYLLCRLISLPLEKSILLDSIRHYLLSENPNQFTQALESYYKSMTRPTASISCINTLQPNSLLKVRVESQYSSRIGVALYQVKDPKKRKNRSSYDLSELTFIEDKELFNNNPEQISIDSTYFNIRVPGIYLVTPIVEGVSTDAIHNYGEVVVTNYMPFIVRVDSIFATALVSINDGLAVNGADVTLYNPWLNKDVSIGRTDYRGVAIGGISESSEKKAFSANVCITKDDSCYYLGNNQTIYYQPKGNIVDSIDAEFFLSRPIFHPGDVVDWAMVLGSYDSSNFSSQVRPATEVEVFLYDANHEKVDSATLVTDDYGRVCGSFRIPKARLTGYYSLELKSTSLSPKLPRKIIRRFMVSDFKPAEIELADVNVSVNDNDGYIISGRVLTMSGMGLANSQVHLQFSPMYYWWWWRFNDTDAKSLSLEVVTDNNGYFTQVINMSDLTPKCDYKIELRAVSPSGEASDYITFLNNSDVVCINSDVGEWNTDSKSVLPIKVERSGIPFSVDADWTLLHDGDKVASGECRFDSTGVAIDLSSYPAADYKLVFSLPSAFKAVGDTIDITTYSVKRNLLPLTSTLILPSSSINIKPNDVTTFKLGVSKNTSVYLFYLSTNNIESIERKDLNKGFHDIRLPEFQSGKQMKVVIAIFEDESFIHRCVEVNYEDQDLLCLNIESWRDKLVPNTEETISFKVSHIDGTPVNAGLISTMYNRALNKLQRYSYTQSSDIFSRFSRYNYINYAISDFVPTTIDIHCSKPIGRRINFSVELPRFAYLNSFGPRYNLRYSAEGVVTYASANLEQVGSPEMSKSSVLSVDSSIDSIEESKVTDNELPTFDYREGEVLQSFFYPNISFGHDGSATLSYKVPNANGSWQFIATAWDKMGNCDTEIRSAISNKPVMVQPNLPRFLREGDVANVSVSLFNNTDNDAIVEYRYEIFEPYTDSIISSQSQQIAIKSGASRVETIQIAATIGMQSVGVRCKATLGNYTDGEQNLIPILDSGLTLYDSETFYLSESNLNYESTVPATDRSALIKLQYCANPMWDVVKSITPLYNSQPKTSIDAACSIYGALTARGLSNKYPQINHVLNYWISNPSDSSLVSKLYKNEEIKLAMLQQTQWMKPALEQTEQMMKLSLTFNDEQIERTLNEGISTLERLQQSDGGFSWGTWNKESTFWCTYAVLNYIGKLNRWGFVDDITSLNRIVDNAFKYVDNNVSKDDISYAYLLTLYPDRIPSTLNAQAALHQTLQFEVANWQKASTSQKAQWALTLYHYGYSSVAKHIIYSIRQFEVKSAQAGISFPSVESVDTYAIILEAFATIDPIESELDAMCQWLVLRSQVSADLMACDRLSLISAILTTVNGWEDLHTAQVPVYIGDKPFRVDSIEMATGAFIANIPLTAVGDSIIISRPSGQRVAYGSITSVYTKSLDEIQARGSSELSISKRILVKRNGQWFETDTVAVGELAQVQLHINSSRDMQYLTIVDSRPASFEPVVQTPGYIFSNGVALYRENNDVSTNLFIDYLPRGTYYISYDMNVNVEGSFASGPATIQSQYAPELNARSGSMRVEVKPFISN